MSANETEERRQRLRLTYEKGDAIKFISHQDEFRLWERTLRRAGLPLLYKKGFNPQPHMQFAAPLGLGMVGANETLDIIFGESMSLGEIGERIRSKLPPGVLLHHIEEVDLKAKAPQSLTIGADYRILLLSAPGEIDPGLIERRIEDFLASEQVWRQRERHGEAYRYNLRPLVFELSYEGYNPESEEHRIFLRVQMLPGATGRPDEVVDALGFDDFARVLRRERIYFSNRTDDVEIMSAYPEISQESISDGAKPKRRRKRGRKKPPRRQKEAVPQAFAEKAKDEFV